VFLEFRAQNARQWNCQLAGQLENATSPDYERIRACVVGNDRYHDAIADLKIAVPQTLPDRRRK
jgi:hypothetical protein